MSEILTEPEFEAIERWMTGEDFTEETWSYAVYCEAWRHVDVLIVSHRLLSARVKELEAELHPEPEDESLRHD